jgi:hypothetical protein
MERTPEGTPVGVDDPYEFAGPCDHLTNDGRCRFALDRAGHESEFVAARRRADYDCLVADDHVDHESTSVPTAEQSGDGTEWRECPQYRSTTAETACQRCGLEEVRLAHEATRPLLETHHLSYHSRGTSHEITVTLCRWCHAKVHNSFARIDDDAAPTTEALAAREERKSREQAEFGFTSARERYDSEAASSEPSGPTDDDR